MTSQEAWALYERYLAAWNTHSIERRWEIAADILSEDVAYHTPRHDVCVGRSNVVEDMAAFQQNFPGAHFEIGDVSSHHDVALLTWVIVQEDGTTFAQGHDQLTIDRDGRIARITTFAPPEKIQT